MNLTDADSRRLVLQPSSVDLWELGHAISRDGADFGDGLSSALLADMLTVRETECWALTTRPRNVSDEMFAPVCVVPVPEGTRGHSWTPEDLPVTSKETVRNFAKGTQNEFVRFRLSEILWSRSGEFGDAKTAIAARLATATLADTNDHWPNLVRHLGRSAVLIVRTNSQASFDSLLRCLDKAANDLLACTHPFGFTVLVDAICHALLEKRWAREKFGAARAQAWSSHLEELANKYRGDPHHGHDALMMLQAWHGRWDRVEDAQASRRNVVAHLRVVAAASDPMMAVSHVDRALQVALNFGIQDLVDELRSDLRNAIQKSAPSFKRYEQTFQLPAEAIAVIDQVFENNPTVSGAVRQLAIIPGLLELNREETLEAAREQLKEHPLLGLLPSVQYDFQGKITHRTNDFEGNVAKHAALMLGVHLSSIEALLRRAIAHLLPRITPNTMVEAFADWPCLVPQRKELLVVASERFAAADWVSSTFIAATTYEAMLRDLLRADGYSALKSEPGNVQMDEALNSLIRGGPARKVLGNPHCDLVEYVLCEPALGWNLRNEVAHGTLSPATLSPERSLLVWLLIVRLTCFAPVVES